MCDWHLMQPPADITLADGSLLPNEVGAEAFNYYDMKVVTVRRKARVGDGAKDTSGTLPGGVTWWLGMTDGSSLDGSRMCSLATAKRRGYL